MPRIGLARSAYFLPFLYQHFAEGTDKSTKKFQDNRSLRQDLKPVPSEYKARVLKAWPQR